MYQDKRFNLGKKNVAGPDLNRQQEISEDGGNAGNDKQEDHDDAMQGEHGVVGLGAHDGFTDGHQFGADQQTEDRGRAEPEKDQHHIHQSDPLVVGGQQPGADPGLARRRGRL